MRALALAEARLLVRHPLMLAGLALALLAAFDDVHTGMRPAFSAITATQAMFFGMPAFFAANLAASRARRAGTEELLAPVPLSRAARTAASCLAALGPFAVACLAQAAALAVYLATGVRLPRLPTVWELGAGPLCVLGACLLGLAVARWVALPGVPLLVMIGLVSFSIVVNDLFDSGHLLGFNPEVVYWGPPPYLDFVGFVPGSLAWHDAYLLALGLGAAALAMLRDSSVRALWLGVGAATVVAAAVSGALAMP